jgi:hypothetical protein
MILPPVVEAPLPEVTECTRVSDVGSANGMVRVCPSLSLSSSRCCGVSAARLDPDGTAVVEVLLTISGCPLRSTIETDVAEAVRGVDGVHRTVVEPQLGVLHGGQGRGQAGIDGVLLSHGLLCSEVSRDPPPPTPRPTSAGRCAARDYVRSELRDLFEELLEELNEPEGADDADPEPSSRKRKGRKKQRSGETVAARSAGLEQPSALSHGHAQGGDLAGQVLGVGQVLLRALAVALGHDLGCGCPSSCSSGWAGTRSCPRTCSSTRAR